MYRPMFNMFNTKQYYVCVCRSVAAGSSGYLDPHQCTDVELKIDNVYPTLAYCMCK